MARGLENVGLDESRKRKAIAAATRRYVNSQEVFKQVKSMFWRALQGYEKTLSKDHTSALNTVNNLGLLYANQRQLDEANEIFERALQGREKVLGGGHTSTLDTVTNLGTLYRD
ncbi:hypothetical protein LTR10_017081 [Elasticomyces elasticus]|uniref:Uncharacterized protein n=1 Tax=Exophiala sideris TaxID=1016849 RepID=A0ABR0JE74_9EURO|nr:hypothetical protein LTR10_017081 [Elasticomyces elasticus]KAK5032620.1 hypothetical protein LTS07_004030 [Exophiala sideris]KAK5037199.1 hypothetical protein LTR13_005004 [Exophiala sideris]KAK5062145.1 hypothetical protein LTR69_004503 [Exophiala sideris]KAK5182357.1 hypothetical protein LTR44_005368 [Eurotiomycetes sp. CCFEE 6388]